MTLRLQRAAMTVSTRTPTNSRAKTVFCPDEEEEADPRSQLEKAAHRIRRHVPKENFVFLDSANLANVRQLMQNVDECSAFFLLLTRETLERPVVLAELCCAHKTANKRLVPIKVEWPDAAKNGRDFRFPTDLEECINDWRVFVETRKRKGIAARKAMGDRDNNPSEREYDSGRSGTPATGRSRSSARRSGRRSSRSRKSIQFAMTQVRCCEMLLETMRMAWRWLVGVCRAVAGQTDDQIRTVGFDRLDA